jgi:hypothetical protein
MEDPNWMGWKRRHWPKHLPTVRWGRLNGGPLWVISGPFRAQRIWSAKGQKRKLFAKLTCNLRSAGSPLFLERSHLACVGIQCRPDFGTVALRDWPLPSPFLSASGGHRRHLRKNEMQDDLGRTPDLGMGTCLLVGFGAVGLVAAIFVLWTPWNSFHVADKLVPGTTICASTNQPAALAEPFR